MKAWIFSVIVAFSILSCAPNSSHSGHASSSAPARVDRATTLSELSTVVLTAEAERALAVQVSPVQSASVARRITVAGEVMVAPGQEVTLAAPVSARVAATGSPLVRPGEQVQVGQLLVRLIPIAPVDRDLRPRAARDVAVARSDLALAEVRVARAETMVADRSGSQRALDDARAQRAVAAAALVAAQARVRSLAGSSLDSDVSLQIRSPVAGIVRAVRVSLGQSVPQGVAMFEIAAEGRYVRASFLASDGDMSVHGYDPKAIRLGSDESVPLVPSVGPPSADAIRATIDRFYQLPEDNHWMPGERVLVSLAVRETEALLSVGASAVLRDAEGGAWVFEQTAPHSFRRRRITVVRREGDQTLYARGPAVGTAIVSTGAVELWGFELGADR